MGFLLGGFTKSMALSRMNDIQKKMSRIQSQIRRVHRESDHMSKAIEREKKAALNSIKYENQQANMIAQNNLMGTIQTTLASLGATDVTQLDAEGQSKYNSAMNVAQTYMSQAQANANMSAQQKLAAAEEYYDQLKTDMVEPLADEEEELKEEKVHLEDEYQLAQQDYQAAQKMTAEDGKLLAPAYTGSASA